MTSSYLFFSLLEYQRLSSLGGLSGLGIIITSITFHNLKTCSSVQEVVISVVSITVALETDCVEFHLNCYFCLYFNGGNTFYLSDKCCDGFIFPRTRSADSTLFY